MKKIVVIVLAVLVILAGVGYSVFWFQQAGVVEANVKNWFATINNSDYAKKEELSAQYDEVSVTGFPTKFVINIKNPAFEYTPESLRSVFFSGTPQLNADAPEAVKAEGKLKDSWKLNGVVMVDANTISNRYTVTSKGASEGVFRDSQGELPWKSNDGSLTITVVTSGAMDGKLLSHLNLANPQEITDLLKSVREVTTVSTPMEITHAESGDSLLSSGEAKFNIFINDPSSPKLESHGMMLVTDVQMSEAYQQAYNRFAAQFRGAPESMGENMAMSDLFSSSKAGKQDVDIAYTLSASRNLDFAKDGEVDLNIASMRFKNDFYDISLPLAFTYQRKDNQVNSTWKLDGSMQYSQGFGESLQAQADQVAQQLFSGGNAIALAVMGVSTAPDPEAFKAKVATLIPAFDKVGPIKLVIDGGFKGQVVPGNPAPAGTLNVTDINLSHSLWGLDVKGDMVVPENKANMTILCTKCDTLVTDLLTYIRNGQELAAMLNKDYVVFPITEKLIADVKNFIRTIGKGESAEDVTITVVSDGAGSILVSDKPFPEVQSLALQTFLPYMMQMQQQQMQDQGGVPTAPAPPPPSLPKE